jgi:hypothetical protein
MEQTWDCPLILRNIISELKESMDIKKKHRNDEAEGILSAMSFSYHYRNLKNLVKML